MNRDFFFRAAFLGTAFIYLVIGTDLPVEIRWFVKTLPVWILCFYVFLSLKDVKGRLLLTGLIFGSLGDVALALKFPNQFITGLGLFLIGHIFYSISFQKQWQYRISRAGAAFSVLLLAFMISVWMAPSLGEMTVPVIAYVFIISIMAVFAAFRSPAGWTVFAGAVSFIVSDALIAVNEFIQPVPYENFAIMITYYAAQGLIAIGSVHDHKKQSSESEEE